MVIERIDDEKIVITIENKIDAFDIQSLIDYARYLETTARSQTKRSDDALADEGSPMWLGRMNGFDESLNGDDVEITPLVKSLCGVIKLPQDFDYKTEYQEYLTQKYK